MSGVFVGVDGGGTRTRAVGVDQDGAEIARVVGPPSLIDPLHPGRAADAVEETLRTLSSEGGVALPCEAVWAGLAGAGHEASRDAVEADLRGRGLAHAIRVGTDVDAALADAFPEAPGVLLVSGTGSIAAARARDGETRRVGGWGALLGDEGSGYAVGLAGLRAAMRMLDGRERATELLPALVEWSGIEAAEDLPAWIATSTKAEVAALAATVVAAADAGDPVAGHILAGAVEALVDHVRALSVGTPGMGRAGTAAGRPAADPVDVALAGGMLDGAGASLLRPRVVAALEENSFRVIPRRVDAARGAALRALGQWRKGESR